MVGGKILVVIPTFNEKENIKPLIEEILALGIPRLSVLVVDDESPDGTGEIVTKLTQKYQEKVHLLSSKKEGRGAAVKRGFAKALAMGADLVVEMDADY